MPSRLLVLAALLVVALAALSCAPAARDANADEWVRSEWSPHEREVRDRGRGVLFAAPGAERPAPPRTDTLLFRGEPHDTSPPIALLLTEYDGTGGWRYLLLSRESMEPNLLEYGYEEAGVPFDSVTANRWARGILGFRSDGAPVRGWTPVQAGAGDLLHWEHHLPTQMLFLPQNWSGSFHLAPEGTVAEPPPDLDDVSVHVVEVRPPWIRLRFVSPADACVADDDRSRSETLRWIRYLDERGRPTVWYYTRGC